MHYRKTIALYASTLLPSLFVTIDSFPSVFQFIEDQSVYYSADLFFLTLPLSLINGFLYAVHFVRIAKLDENGSFATRLSYYGILMIISPLLYLILFFATSYSSFLQDLSPNLIILVSLVPLYYAILVLPYHLRPNSQAESQLKQWLQIFPIGQLIWIFTASRINLLAIDPVDIFSYFLGLSFTLALGMKVLHSLSEYHSNLLTQQTKSLLSKNQDDTDTETKIDTQLTAQ